MHPTIVKLVQTGAADDDLGDAQRAGALTGCPAVELARFVKAVDPWSAALAEGMPPVRAEDLAAELWAIEGGIVAEGVGGLGVPLNRAQDFATIARLAELRVVLTVGLRPGCMNHALLTLALCAERRLSVAGCVLVDRWGHSQSPYVRDVRQVLQGKAQILGILDFQPDEQRSVLDGAKLFKSMT